MGETAGWALGVLACWRLTHLLWAEDGPGRLIAHWRDSLPRSPDSGLPVLVGCFYCLSLWVAVPLSGLVLLITLPGEATPGHWLGAGALGSLGLSGGAITLERWLDGHSPLSMESAGAAAPDDLRTTDPALSPLAASGPGEPPSPQPFKETLP